MKIFLTILIALMQAFIVIIPLRGKLSDNRFNFPKSFTKLGYWLIACCVITILSTVGLFFLSEKEENESRKSLSTQLAQRDSIHQMNIDNANVRYVHTLDSSNKETIRLLAEYGLQYDSSQKVIEKLVRDSSKRNLTIVENPELSFCASDGINDVTFRNDTLFLKVNLCSAKSISRIDSLKITTLVCDGDYNGLIPGSLKLVSKDYLVEDDDSQVESNSKTIVQMRYPRAPKGNMVYIRLKGTYKNQDQSKVFKVDIVHGYDIKNKQYGSATPIPNRLIRTFIESL